jgi:Transposase
LVPVTTVGLDLAKHVFQVHGIDASGRVIVAKALRRKDVLAFFAQLPECLVGMEACGSAHHWARELIKLGHDARMMPPAYVKPYVRRQKNDAADAAGICEAVTRPSMRFVGVRTLENQAALMHQLRLSSGAHDVHWRARTSRRFFSPPMRSDDACARQDKERRAASAPSKAGARGKRSEKPPRLIGSRVGAMRLASVTRCA